MESPLLYLNDGNESSGWPDLSILIERGALRLDLVLEAAAAVSRFRQSLFGLALADGEPILETLRLGGIDIWGILAPHVFWRLADSIYAELHCMFALRSAGTGPVRLSRPELLPNSHSCLDYADRLGIQVHSERYGAPPPAQRKAALSLGLFYLERKYRWVRRDLSARLTFPAITLETESNVLFAPEWKSGFRRIVEPVAHRLFPGKVLHIARGWSWRDIRLNSGLPWIEAALPRGGRGTGLGAGLEREIEERIRAVERADPWSGLLRSAGLSHAAWLERALRLMVSAGMAKRIVAEHLALSATLDSLRPRAIFGASYDECVMSGIIDRLAAERGIQNVKVLSRDTQLCIPWAANHLGAFDRLMVLSDTIAARLEAAGVPRAKLFSTGHPIFDRAAGAKPRERRRGPELIALWATQGQRCEIPIARALGDALRADSRLRLLLRRHPGGPALFLRCYLPIRRCRLSNARRHLIFDTARADAIVCHSSNTAMEAIIMDMDVIVAVPGLLTVNPLYGLATEWEAALLVTDLRKLGKALASLRDDSGIRDRLAAGRRRLLRELFFCGGEQVPTDSLSAIAGHLAEALRENHSRPERK